jgi:hypothetical protein
MGNLRDILYPKKRPETIGCHLAPQQMYNRPSMRIIAAQAFLISILCGPLSAQWFGYPTPGMPRTADGKPNLSAPAPKAADGHPDLSGVWSANSAPLQVIAPEASIPFQPWSLKLTHDRADGARGKDDPASYCVPGMPKLIVLPYPYKIVQVPGMMLMLYEGFTTYRQVFTDGRALPKDPNPAWLGYSVGKWDGDAFVVDTIGVNDRTWLDNAGRPHSDAMHLTERYHRRDFGHLEVQLTIDDPKAYAKPWTVNESAVLLPDTDLLEYACSENNKDVPHLVGK